MDCPEDGCNCSNPTYESIPLQEQVEQQDAHIFSLEDALEKTVDVITALMAERKDLHDQVYQAQVDAQDWQNKYNEVSKINYAVRQMLPESLGGVYLEDAVREVVRQCDKWKKDASDWEKDSESWEENYFKLKDESRICDAEQIRELTNEVQEAGQKYEDLIVLSNTFITRIQELTDQNTQLELRNERQFKMINVAKMALIGNDINGNQIT